MIASGQKLLMAAAAKIQLQGWDISTAVFNGTPPFEEFSVTAQVSSAQGVFFKPDGTKMYVTDSSGRDVNEYDLSTAWDILTASYLQNFSVSSQELTPTQVFFKPDGTKMYIVGANGDEVNEYDLSTAWDISTASYLQNFSVSAQDTGPQGLFFKPDGTKMYVVGLVADDVNEYDLSTAWDISTASYLQNFSVAAQEAVPTGVFFKPDGTKMYVIGGSGDDVNEYDLSTAWDVSSASYLQNFSISNQELTPTDLFFKPDGTKMYIIGSTNTVYAYNLSTAWDVTTAVHTVPSSDYFVVRAEEANPTDLFFKPDGTKMYIVGSGGDEVNEYDLSTPWDVDSASYSQRLSVALQEAVSQSLFFKPDGTKMYITGSSGDDVNEYNLSTAWDISTASYLQNFSVAAQETNPLGLFFKPDGTKMYIVGSIGDDVNEYNLSTAWDISTASYLQNFSVAAQEGVPGGVFFKPNGTKMYIIGEFGDAVNEYNLSTAWDISTASYLQNFSVAAQEVVPTGLFFKPDGLEMYVVGLRKRGVFQYTLTPV